MLLLKCSDEYGDPNWFNCVELSLPRMEITFLKPNLGDGDPVPADRAYTLKVVKNLTFNWGVPEAVVSVPKMDKFLMYPNPVNDELSNHKLLLTWNKLLLLQC